MNAINKAIAACPEGQVVTLGTGSYTITNGLTFGTKNNVTLRGAGPDQTILKFTGPGRQECGGYGSVCLWGNSGETANPASYVGSHSWTGTDGIAGTYSQGAAVLNLDSVSGLQVGQIIILDQRNDDIGLCPPSGGMGVCLNAPGITEKQCNVAPCTVTVNTSIPHGFRVGQRVGIGGFDLKVVGGGPYDPSAYVGFQTITSVPTPTSFEYKLNAADLPDMGSTDTKGAFATLDTTGVYVSGVRYITIAENLDVGRACPDTMNPPTCEANETSWRSQTEVKVITGVDPVNKSVTISPGLYYPNWRRSQAPGVYWFAPTSGTENNLSGNYAIRDGIEDLTVDYTPQPQNTSIGGIELRHAYQCWVKNVRSINGNRNGVWIRNGSKQNEVVDSYFVGQHGSGSQSYGVEMFGATAGNLVQNNIFQHIVLGVAMGGSVGSVVSYNYAVDDGYYVQGLMMPMLNVNHDVNAYNLFEGNNTPSVNSDDVHGTGNLSTFFRSRLRGQSTPIKTGGLIAADVAAYNRGMNFVGNVMGTVGAQTRYFQTNFTSGYVWSLTQGSEYPGSGVGHDTLTLSSLLRWGNYDVVTGAARWCGNSSTFGWFTACNSASEMPTVGIKFINGNPVPSSTRLPPSFYLSTPPSFWHTPWATPPWPAIGPDVKGGTAPDSEGGHSYAIPAQVCYLNTPTDPAYSMTGFNVLLFNAVSCYPRD